nr:hypothetical protein Iba_chr11aCG16140 [Ipomoea batatas]
MKKESAGWSVVGFATVADEVPGVVATGAAPGGGATAATGLTTGTASGSVGCGPATGSTLTAGAVTAEAVGGATSGSSVSGGSTTPGAATAGATGGVTTGSSVSGGLASSAATLKPIEGFEDCASGGEIEDYTSDGLMSTGYSDNGPFDNEDGKERDWHSEQPQPILVLSTPHKPRRHRHHVTAAVPGAAGDVHALRFSDERRGSGGGVNLLVDRRDGAELELSEGGGGRERQCEAAQVERRRLPDSGGLWVVGDAGDDGREIAAGE